MSAEKEGKHDRSKVGGVELPAWLTEAREGTCLEEQHPEAHGASKQIPIDKAKCYLVGRHEGEFNVVVDHVTVSRRHALLVHKGDSVFLYDISSNGSFINGAPAQRKEYTALKVGDTLRFGDHPSTFTLAAIAPPAASAAGTPGSKQTAPVPNRRRTSSEQQPAASPQPALHNPMVIYGLKLHMGAKGLEVRTVEPGSVAEAHPFPFSWGDIVMSIDDVDTSAMSREELVAALERGRASPQVRLTVKKGGQERHVTLSAAAKAQPAADSLPAQALGGSSNGPYKSASGCPGGEENGLGPDNALLPPRTRDAGGSSGHAVGSADDPELAHTHRTRESKGTPSLPCSPSLPSANAGADGASSGGGSGARKGGASKQEQRADRAARADASASCRQPAAVQGRKGPQAQSDAPLYAHPPRSLRSLSPPRAAGDTGGWMVTSAQRARATGAAATAAASEEEDSDSESDMEELDALHVREEVITAQLMAELHPVRMRKILIEALQKQRYAEAEVSHCQLVSFAS
jgi:hypothetical protein